MTEFSFLLFSESNKKNKNIQISKARNIQCVKYVSAVVSISTICGHRHVPDRSFFIIFRFPQQKNI